MDQLRNETVPEQTPQDQEETPQYPITTRPQTYFPIHLVDKTSSKEGLYYAINQVTSDKKPVSLKYCYAFSSMGACVYGSGCRYAHAYEHAEDPGSALRDDIIIGKLNTVLKNQDQILEYLSKSEPTWNGCTHQQPQISDARGHRNYTADSSRSTRGYINQNSYMSRSRPRSVEPNRRSVSYEDDKPEAGVSHRSRYGRGETLENYKGEEQALESKDVNIKHNDERHSHSRRSQTNSPENVVRGRKPRMQKSKDKGTPGKRLSSVERDIKGVQRQSQMLMNRFVKFNIDK